MKRALTVVAGGAVALAPVLLTGTASAAGRPATVYVSPTGHSGARDTSCQSAAYSVINDAIMAVTEGGTVVVCKGTYEQTATVNRTLTLLGRTGAVIDAAGLQSGIQVDANDVTVHGFTVEHAIVGIRLTGGDQARIISNDSRNNVHTGVYLNDTSHSYVADNTVSGNPIYGIELGKTSYARIIHNHVTGNSSHTQGSGIGIEGSYGAEIVNNVVEDNNSGGIGLANSPASSTDYNTVTGNQVRGNYYSGIVLTAFAQTATQYATDHNIISGNTVTRNGLGGNGQAGISLGGDFFFEPNDSSVYISDNTVTGNRISGNGGPGVAVHAYADTSLGEQQYMDGNVITGNSIGTNNLVGDSTVSNLPDAPPTLTVSQTTGVLLASTTPLAIEVSANTIYSNYYGIWKNNLVDASGLETNHFGNVIEPMYTYGG